MTKTVTLVVAMLLAGYVVRAQGKGDMMFGGGLDIVKSNNIGLGKKVQLGVEGNYFFNSQITATIGIENWTYGRTSLVLGGRYYIQNNIFARMRVLLVQNDFSIGGGYSHSLNKHWRLEGLADIYFVGDVALRGGVAYLLFK